MFLSAEPSSADPANILVSNKRILSYAVFSSLGDTKHSHSFAAILHFSLTECFDS